MVPWARGLFRTEKEELEDSKINVFFFFKFAGFGPKRMLSSHGDTSSGLTDKETRRRWALVLLVSLGVSKISKTWVEKEKKEKRNSA